MITSVLSSPPEGKERLLGNLKGDRKSTSKLAVAAIICVTIAGGLLCYFYDTEKKRDSKDSKPETKTFADPSLLNRKRMMEAETGEPHEEKLRKKLSGFKKTYGFLRDGNLMSKREGHKEGDICFLHLFEGKKNLIGQLEGTIKFKEGDNSRFSILGSNFKSLTTANNIAETPLSLRDCTNFLGQKLFTATKSDGLVVYFFEATEGKIHWGSVKKQSEEYVRQEIEKLRIKINQPSSSSPGS